MNESESSLKQKSVTLTNPRESLDSVKDKLRFQDFRKTQQYSKVSETNGIYANPFTTGSLGFKTVKPRRG